MDVPSHAEVVEKIDAFLDRHDMAPSSFGRKALGEPQFVSQVRAGRLPNLSTLRKLTDFMQVCDDDAERLAMEPTVSGPAAGPHRLNAGVR
jgi:hypothetical protein